MDAGIQVLSATTGAVREFEDEGISTLLRGVWTRLLVEKAAVWWQPLPASGRWWGASISTPGRSLPLAGGRGTRACVHRAVS